jgi:hypothetical protein
LAQYNATLQNKWLSVAIAAITYRITAIEAMLLNPKATQHDLAAIDYGNDIGLLKIILADMQEALVVAPLENTATALQLNKYKEIQEAWPSHKQLLFVNVIAFKITVCIRDINANNAYTVAQKLAAVVHLNELQHSMLQFKAAFESNESYNLQYAVFNDIQQHLSSNVYTENYLNYLLVQPFKKIEKMGDKNYNDFSKKFLVYQQALNEVCHGAYALPHWEFATLMGVSKPEAVKILNDSIDLWKE